MYLVAGGAGRLLVAEATGVRVGAVVRVRVPRHLQLPEDLQLQLRPAHNKPSLLSFSMRIRVNFVNVQIQRVTWCPLH